jgi:hypothetical protein
MPLRKMTYIAVMEVEDKDQVASFKDNELVTFMGKRHVLMAELLDKMESLL